MTKEKENEGYYQNKQKQNEKIEFNNNEKAQYESKFGLERLTALIPSMCYGSCSDKENISLQQEIGVKYHLRAEVAVPA